MIDRELRLAVFCAAANGEFGSIKDVGKAIRKREASVKEAVLEMESMGIPRTGNFQEVSTAQAAWVLGLIERRIRDFCRAGRLGRQVGGRYIVPVEDLIRFAKTPRYVGGAGVKALAAARAGKGEDNGEE